MKISIITLNYNGSKETLELLRSLKEQIDTDFEIILVDNASEKADFSHLQNSLTSLNDVHLQVKVARNSENLGFSGGNNIGIRLALKNGSEWIVLLNNDTQVERGFVERLRGVLEAKSGVIGIPLIEGDRVAYCGGVRWLKPTLIHITTRRVVHEESADKLYAIGGAMAVHKSVFEKIGLLDEKYFLYFEDADFSLRARKAGFDISIVKDLSVHHHVSSSAKKLGSPLLLRYHYRNALYFNLKNGPWYIKLLVWPWSLIVVIKQLGKLVINRNKEGSKSILNGIADFYFNKMGKIKK